MDITRIGLNLCCNSNRDSFTCYLLLSFIIQEEKLELKRQKADSGDDYGWTDYMSLSFTQNVSINGESCVTGKGPVYF